MIEDPSAEGLRDNPNELERTISITVTREQAEAILPLAGALPGLAGFLKALDAALAEITRREEGGS